MARYIDADKLKMDSDIDNFDMPYGCSFKVIDRQPTADVVEVKHGEWKEHFAFGCWHYDCPFCDDGYVTKIKDKTSPNYCGNCGAKLVVAKNATTATTEEGVMHNG